ncbi:MAG: molybdate ABC transporter permease subunit [Anaerolineaceae bacterium]|nr:molybdate ABC transporter permease subunit [Anaerolineaceae bacterium]MCB9099692.1 molybdate ABC transporter permease subunit [Anaerolineales bacterium]
MAQSTLPWARRPQRSTRPAVRLRDPWWLLSLPLLFFLALPIAAMFIRTPPSQLLANLAEVQVIQAISLSLLTTSITLVVTIIFGTPVAYLLGRYDFPFRRAIDTLLDLPTVLPPSVAGVALLMAFGRRGLVGEWLEVGGLHIAFTQVAVILAQTFIAAPFYVKAAMLGFAGVDRDLEQAAALDGAGGWQAFRFVTLPLAWTALLSGAVMTWARALGEFGATIIFAGNYPGRTQTMPLAIYIGFELDLDIALTLSVILVGCSFVVLLVVKGLLQRELEPNTN